MEKILKFLPHMCGQQKRDIEDLLLAADEIGAAAVSVANGAGQGYNLLLDARDKFKNILLTQVKHYRVCVEEDSIDSTTDPNYFTKI